MSIHFTSIVALIFGLIILFIRLFLINDPSDYPKEDRVKIQLDAIRILVLGIFFLVIGIIMFLYSYFTYEETSFIKDLILYLKVFCFFILMVGIILLYYKENIFCHIKSNGLKVPKDFRKYRSLIIFIGIIFVITGLVLIIWYYAIPFISKYYLIDI